MSERKGGAHAGRPVPAPSADGAHAENVVGAGALAVADRLRGAVAAASGLDGSAPAALVALDVFAEGEGVETLARAMSISHSGAVRLVDQLAARGLVRRERSASDGRAVALKLTASGRRVAASIAAARRAVLADLLAPLDAADRDRLAGLLGEVLAGQTSDRDSACRLCRLCDADACGHPDRCPVTQARLGAAS